MRSRRGLTRRFEFSRERAAILYRGSQPVKTLAARTEGRPRPLALLLDNLKLGLAAVGSPRGRGCFRGGRRRGRLRRAAAREEQALAVLLGEDPGHRLHRDRALARYA